MAVSHEWVRDEARASLLTKRVSPDAGFVAKVQSGSESVSTSRTNRCSKTSVTLSYPEVIVEFGARSTGEPHARRCPIVCDAAAYLPDLVTFRETHPTVMLAKRTFWEKGDRRFTSSAARSGAGASVCRKALARSRTPRRGGHCSDNALGRSRRSRFRLPATKQHVLHRERRPRRPDRL